MSYLQNPRQNIPCNRIKKKAISAPQASRLAAGNPDNGGGDDNGGNLE